MMKKDDSPQLVTPISVKTIISRIEAAQISRAQEDVSSQLSDILDNVNSVINSFQEELGYDLKDKAKTYHTEQKSKNRLILLEKIASFSKGAKTKEEHLYEILHWLCDWGDNLTYEIRNRKSEEEEAALDEWIDVMENVLPLSLIATKGGIESLISLCSTLIEEQKKKTQMSKHTFWQGWREKSPPKSPPEPQPLSPEQMLQDKQTTFTRVSEVKSMLQELLDSNMFNKGEVKAIRYMSAVVENLNNALILQHKENRTLETKYRHMKAEMTKELNSQKLYFQKSLKILENKKDALLKQVEILGGKYHDLLLIKHALELQLRKAQSASRQAEDSADKTFIDVPDPAQKEILPKKVVVMELPTKVLVSQQEPKKEEQLLLPSSPNLMATAWNNDDTLPTMATHLRIADIYCSKDIESFPPALPSTVDFNLYKTWERPVAESLYPKDEHQEDFFQESQDKGELQGEFHFRKQQSPESSREVSPENKEAHLEEELSWQSRKQQWLKEEEMWLQRQKKWALLEQAHQEKLWQWEMDGNVRKQQQRFAEPGKKQESPRREPERPRKDTEKMISMPTSRRKELEKAERSLVPPSRVQSVHQGRSSYLSRSPSIQKSAPVTQRTVSSAEPTPKPQRTPQVPTKPKKSASFPVTGTSIKKVAWPSLQTCLVAPKEKVYGTDMEAQTKNLELPSEASELGLPNHLHSKSMELTSTSLGLNSLRLHYLCHKYITYRRFQRLRQEVINYIQVMQISGATHKAQSLYIFLENIDNLQNLKLQAWMKKQKDLEEKHLECRNSMATMFPKVQQEWNAHLNIPVATIPKAKEKQVSSSLLPVDLFQWLPQEAAFGRVSVQSARMCAPVDGPVGAVKPRGHLAHGQQGSQMEAVWKTDVASSSHPVEKKTPLSLQWDQLGGYPDIPRLLALDVHSSYHKSLMSLNTRSSTTHKNKSQKSIGGSADLVHKKSCESLPGPLKKPEG